MKNLAKLGSAAVVFSLLTQLLCAQETNRVQKETATQIQNMTQVQSKDRVYGSSLMTEQERNAYQNQMQQLKTEQERADFRAEHHEQMTQRAKAQGKTLPDDIPANSGGQRSGKGQGMGQGGQSMGGGKGSGGGNKHK